ncbi:hypothetical protein llap_8900 [Limosa lapponica baueri]|uniref:Uncharacterized protein n=1 Tax=Limosa lapponica baueri TaxID=1758121 RepID=A0A2I0U410_LIMLA|nr:hypothetical protein llap_8900 [Limosa lapponica baueri]
MLTIAEKLALNPYWSQAMEFGILKRQISEPTELSTPIFINSPSSPEEFTDECECRDDLAQFSRSVERKVDPCIANFLSSLSGSPLVIVNICERWSIGETSALLENVAAIHIISNRLKSLVIQVEGSACFDQFMEISGTLEKAPSGFVNTSMRSYLETTLEHIGSSAMLRHESMDKSIYAPNRKGSPRQQLPVHDSSNASLTNKEDGNGTSATLSVECISPRLPGFPKLWTPAFPAEGFKVCVFYRMGQNQGSQKP